MVTSRDGPQECLFSGSPAAPTNRPWDAITTDVNTFVWGWPDVFTRWVGQCACYCTTTIPPVKRWLRSLSLHGMVWRISSRDTSDCPPSTTMNYGGIDPNLCPIPIHFFDSITGGMLLHRRINRCMECQVATYGSNKRFFRLPPGQFEPLYYARMLRRGQIPAVRAANQNAGTRG